MKIVLSADGILFSPENEVEVEALLVLRENLRIEGPTVTVGPSPTRTDQKLGQVERGLDLNF